VPKKKKIKKTLIPPNGSSRIKVTKLSQPQGISFSFKYLDLHHPKFNCNGKDGGYWQTLMARLKDLSALTALELLRNRHRSLRCHPIDWKNTSEEGFGIPNEEQDVVNLMQKLAREQGSTILLVTHDNRILDIADRIIHLEDGKLINNSVKQAA
jgi:hypothetical protein